MGKGTILIALGGNAITHADQRGTTEEQLLNVDITVQQLTSIIEQGYRIVLTHGNGPQAGSLLIQQEEAASIVPPQDLCVCGAMTQGQIGWMIQNRLGYYLQKKGISLPVASIVTQVMVDADDPDFANPSKPVGPFYTKEQADKLKSEKGYLLQEVKPGSRQGWRRVVPSPEPKEIIEQQAIKALVDSGTLVIASGGGGIPVRKNGDGSFSGVQAVIDKDKAAFILAQTVNADTLLILTDVEHVFLNYHTDKKKPIHTIQAREMQQYYDAGHFMNGSMGPKVLACLRFVQWRGARAIITSLDNALEALEGKTGTTILP